MDLCKTAPVFKLNLPDWAKALVVAILSAPVDILIQSLQANGLVLDWKRILIAGLTGGLAYLAKNFLTGSGGQLLTNKKEEATKPV
jgi:hypothetical protein